MKRVYDVIPSSMVNRTIKHDALKMINLNCVCMLCSFRTAADMIEEEGVERHFLGNNLVYIYKWCFCMNNKRSPNIQINAFLLLHILWYLYCVVSRGCDESFNCNLNHCLTSIVNFVELQTKIYHTATILPPTCSNGGVQRSSVVTPSLLGRSRYSGDGDWTGHNAGTVHWTQDSDSGWHKIHWYDMIHSLMKGYREDGRGPEHEDLNNSLWMSCKISSRRGAGHILVSLRLSIFNNLTWKYFSLSALWV